MKEVLEHYGLGLLEIFGMVGALAIIFGCVQSDGVLSNIVEEYMTTLCG